MTRNEKIILLALAPIGILVALSIIMYRPYWIPSGSMKPTLLIGDYVLANRAAYGFPALMCGLKLCDGGRDLGPLGEMPKRGDVVTFVHPERKVHYVKRVVALPGDTVQMKDGRLFLNGAEAPFESAGLFVERYLELGYLACTNAPVKLGEDCTKAQYSETLPDGRSYHVLNIMNGNKTDNTPLFTVSEGQVFVMGDNRDNSMDSRTPIAQGGIGPVPLDHLVGRVDLIVFSFTGKPDRVLRWMQ